MDRPAISAIIEQFRLIRLPSLSEFLQLGPSKATRFLPQHEQLIEKSVRDIVLSNTVDKRDIWHYFLSSLDSFAHKPDDFCNNYDASDDKAMLLTFVRSLMEYSKDPVMLSDCLEILFSKSAIKSSLIIQVSVQEMEYVLYNSQKARFHLWGTLPFEGPCLEYYLINDNFESISTLIRYGCTIEKAAFPLRKLEDWLRKRRPEGSIFLEPYDGPFWIRWNRRSKREMLINQIVYYATKSAVSKTRENAIACIKLIWKSVPYAYPSRAELEDYMYKEMQTFRVGLMPVWKVCDFFKEAVSGEFSECLQPRTLMQCCRCTIRKQLVQGTHLPGGISSLKLPEKLQKYINFDF